MPRCGSAWNSTGPTPRVRRVTRRMDPLGFAFENYDGIGGWRTRDGKFPVDPAGTLPNGESFKGPAELKAILKKRQDQFSLCLTEEDAHVCAGPRGRRV